MDCNLGPKGDGNVFTVTLSSDEDIEKLCDDAMRHAYKDRRIFQEIKRTSEHEFIKNAYHSVLHNGIYLKRKLREFNGKTNRPSFYQAGEKVPEIRITKGSVINVHVQFKTYCFKGLPKASQPAKKKERPERREGERFSLLGFGVD